MEPIIIQPRIEGENLVYDLRDAANADLNNVYINFPHFTESSGKIEDQCLFHSDVLDEKEHDKRWELHRWIRPSQIEPYGALHRCHQGEELYLFEDERYRNKTCKGRLVKHYDELYFYFDYVIRFGKWWDDSIGRHVDYHDQILFLPENDDEWVDKAAGIIIFTRPYHKDEPLISRYFEIKYNESWRITYPEDEELPWVYEYNFKSLAESKRDLHDDLMAYLYHPRRIEKWLNEGNEVESYLN